MEIKSLAIAGVVGLVAYLLLNETKGPASPASGLPPPSSSAGPTKSEAETGNRRRTLAVTARPHMNRPADTARTLEPINEDAPEPEPKPVHGAVAKEPGTRHEPLHASPNAEWPDFEP